MLTLSQEQCLTFYLCSLIYSLNSNKVDTIITPILQKKTLELREVKQLAQGHTASK